MQVPPDAITEYVVVVVGDATGLAQVVQLKPVDGLQIKLLPPLTFNVVELPIQIVGFVAVTVGAPGCVILIVMVAVPEAHARFASAVPRPGGSPRPGGRGQRLAGSLHAGPIPSGRRRSGCSGRSACRRDL